jgi:hypothetical protein
LNGIDDWDFAYNDVATVGHSLGGALQLFMGVYLWEVFGKTPILGLGFAGPFIGDEEFSTAHLIPYFGRIGSNGWQIEVCDAGDPRHCDGTTETYQVGKENNLFIVEEAVCRFRVRPLPVPTQAYGMHDLKQYRLYTTGTKC